MPTPGVSDYAAGTGLDTVAGNMHDTTGRQQDGSGDLFARIDNLLDLHSQALEALEAVNGGPGTNTAASASTGWTRVKNGDGTVTWQAVPAGTPGATVAELDPSTVSTAGVAAEYSRRDHKHLWKPIFKVRFSFDNVTSPLTGLWPEDIDQASTLLNYRLILGTVASSGSNTKVDLLKNNVSVLTTQPEITVGQQRNSIAVSFASTSLIAGDILLPKITQGSSGAQLEAILTYRWELT